MKRIFSLSTLWQSTKEVIVRFPLQFILILLAVVVWCTAIESEQANQTFHLYKLLVICNIAFIFLLAYDLFSERNKGDALLGWIIRLLIVGLCITLYFCLSPEWVETDVYRMILLIIAGHLLISFAPLYPKKQMQAFWQYNKILFLRILTAFLYSTVLYIGCAVALLSIDTLFNQNISGDTYFELFILIAVGFNTVFFLAGIPKNLHIVAQETDYPKGLKIFTQYVLIPLLTLYLAILLVYEFKILLDGELPKGTVSVLIIAYAVLGILSILLVHPIKHHSGNEWIKVFSRFFFLFMIPLLVLMYFAIAVRIMNYGITELRFFLIVIAIWLTILVIYFIIVKTPNIQLIPLTLCFLTLLFTYGPQSAAAIAKKSQLLRFENLQKEKKEILEHPVEKEKTAIITYLVRNHGLPSLQPLTKVDLKKVQEALKEKVKEPDTRLYRVKEELLDTAFALLNVNPVLYNKYSGATTFEIDNRLTAIAGYEYSMAIQSYDTSEEKETPLGSIAVNHLLEKNMIKIKIGEQDSVLMDLATLSEPQREILSDSLTRLQKDRNTYRLPQDQLTLSASTQHFQLSLVFKSMTMLGNNNTSENKSYSHYHGILLIKNK